MDKLKNTFKSALSRLGIFVSHNQRYDWQLKKIIEGLKPKKNDIVLIDVGAHKGEVTDLALAYHKAACLLFEPIPDFYNKLKNKYNSNEKIEVFNLALTDKKGNTTFQYNHSHPAYSGILKREYPSKNEKIEELTIPADSLDNIMASQQDLDGICLIKIDVEGGELGVLKGAKETIRKYQPLVVFEHGLGASEYYGTEPEEIIQFFEGCNMRIQTMENWLNKKASGLTREAFKKQFYDKINYYFIAYPRN